MPNASPVLPVPPPVQTTKDLLAQLERRLSGTGSTQERLSARAEYWALVMRLEGVSHV